MLDYSVLSGNKSGANKGIEDELQNLMLQGQTAQARAQLEQFQKQQSELNKAKSMIEQYNADPSRFSDMEAAYVQQLSQKLGIKIGKGNYADKKNAPGFFDFSFGKQNQGGALQGLLGGAVDSLLFDLVPDNLYSNRHNKGWTTGGKWAATIGSLALGGYGAIKGAQAAKMATKAAVASMSDELLSVAKKTFVLNADELGRALNMSAGDVAKLGLSGSYDDMLKVLQERRAALTAAGKEAGAAYKANEAALKKAQAQINKAMGLGGRQKLLTGPVDEIADDVVDVASTGSSTPAQLTTRLKSKVNSPVDFTPRGPRELVAGGRTMPPKLQRGIVTQGNKINWQYGNGKIPEPPFVWGGAGGPNGPKLLTGPSAPRQTFAQFSDEIANTNKNITEFRNATAEKLRIINKTRKTLTSAQKTAVENAEKLLSEGAKTAGKSRLSILKSEREKLQGELDKLMKDTKKYSAKDILRRQTLQNEIDEIAKQIPGARMRGIGRTIADNIIAPRAAQSVARDLSMMGSGNVWKPVLTAIPRVAMITSPAIGTLTPKTAEDYAGSPWGLMGGLVEPDYARNRLSRLPLYGTQMSEDQEEIADMMGQ
jgi:hypothetical protein